MSKYVISPLAAEDLEAIGDYIAQDNPRRAITFSRSVFLAGFRLSPE